MAFMFPRVAFTPVRCGPARHDLSSLLSLFDDSARELQRVQRPAKQTPRTFNPRFDVTEGNDKYLLEGEVPGFREQDLSIEWNDNVLAIHGRHESVAKPGQQPNTAVENASTSNDSQSETSSVKSHQATVEDEDEAGYETVAKPTATADTNTRPVTKAPAPEASNAPTVQHWISERRTGEFTRKFSFPGGTVEHDGIKASLEAGILRIVVPKAAPPASRRINIE